MSSGILNSPIAVEPAETEGEVGAPNPIMFQAEYVVDDGRGGFDVAAYPECVDSLEAIKKSFKCRWIDYRHEESLGLLRL